MRGFEKLRVRNYGLFLRASIWTVAVRVGLWTLPFRTVLRLAMGRLKSSETRYSIEQIVWAVRAASRYVPKATCLTQAIVAQQFLSRSGHHCRLRIGVARDAIHGFESHSWVECDGRVVIGESAGASVTSLFTPIAAWER